LSECFAFGPEREGGEHDDEHERRVEQSGTLGDENVE
jgi:hypothetical protein